MWPSPMPGAQEAAGNPIPCFRAAPKRPQKRDEGIFGGATVSMVHIRRSAIDEVCVCPSRSVAHTPPKQ
eukprot:1090167-Alexandrium_andersonii.AAC.1